MPDEPDARSRLLGKIQAGALPLDTPIKTWDDPGKGHVCDGCDQPILAFQIDYEPFCPRAVCSTCTSAASASGRAPDADGMSGVRPADRPVVPGHLTTWLRTLLARGW
jgi:hypothetical protein